MLAGSRVLIIALRVVVSDDRDVVRKQWHDDVVFVYISFVSR